MRYDRLLQLGGIDREVPPIPGYITKEQLQGEIDGIGTLIPEEASPENQLADKQYVDNKVAMDSATFRGSFNLVSDLHLATTATHSDIETALASAITTADNNDYCYVQIPNADATPTEIAQVERYKYDGTEWQFEFDLNTSSFTEAQLAALNSGITSELVTKLDDLPTDNELTTQLNGKQPTINDLSTIRNGAAAGASAYQKPDGGIPKSDLVASVQTSLNKADAAAPQSTTYSKTEVDGLIDGATAYTDVYVGVGAAYNNVMTPANHHDTLIKGKFISFTISNTYLWVILPLTQDPAVLMEGVKVDMVAQNNMTINNVTFRVLKSPSAYTATVNVALV